MGSMSITRDEFAEALAVVAGVEIDTTETVKGSIYFYLPDGRTFSVAAVEGDFEFWERTDGWRR